VTTVVGAIKPAVDALVSLGTYTEQRELGVRLSFFSTQIGEVFEEFKTLATDHAGKLEGALALADLLSATGTAVTAGLDILVSLLSHRHTNVAPSLAQFAMNLTRIDTAVRDGRDLLGDLRDVALEMEKAAVAVDAAIRTAFATLMRVQSMGSGVSIWDGLIQMLQRPPRSLDIGAWNLGFRMARQIEAGLRYGLEMHSPSQVMDRIGQDMKAGMVQGFSRQQPYQPQPIAQSVTHNRSVSVQFGDVSISNDMDLATFEARVNQAVTNAAQGAL